jgi:hypothetical protein
MTGKSDVKETTRADHANGWRIMTKRREFDLTVGKESLFQYDSECYQPGSPSKIAAQVDSVAVLSML